VAHEGLHYRGQDDAAGYAREWAPGLTGGAIDPSIVRDPANGALYLFWAIQPNQIWVGELSADGTTLQPGIQLALAATPGWDCDPVSICIVEAPEPFYRNGHLYLLYSGASTWDSSYAISAATSPDPLTVPYTPMGAPLMQTGNGFIGPGHCSQPVTAPNGDQYIFYHAQRRPSRVSANRLLMLDRLSWVGADPVIGNGIPGFGG
jgi:GH43 family beta-xylosidase